MDSPCSLGFLTAWWPGSKSRSLEKEQGENFILFHDPKSPGVPPHTVSAFVKAASSEFQEEGHIPFQVQESGGSHYQKSMLTTVMAAFGNHSLLRQ